MAEGQSTTVSPPVEYRPAVFRGNPISGYRAGSDGSVLSLWSEQRDRHGRLCWKLGEDARRLLPTPMGQKGRYLGVSLRSGGRTIRASVHALVAESFIGPCPSGMEVCHRDGNGHNNAVGNLRYGTKASNEADKILHGTDQRGERNPSAKLTDDEADAVRWLRSLGFKLRVIARWFRVAESAVSRIANGKRRAR